MYFVHSYYCIPQDEGTIISTTKYAGIEYPSIIQKEIALEFNSTQRRAVLRELKFMRN